MSSLAETVNEIKAERDALVAQLAELDSAIADLAGSGLDATIKRWGPILAKYGGAIAASGGLTALAADGGAFSGILSALGSIFGV